MTSEPEHKNRKKSFWSEKSEHSVTFSAIVFIALLVYGVMLILNSG
ncbi:MAG: hypothetical protein LBK91_01905 [Synergistaceae bacterium]|nr:hypothetical protein [Synergistaceae bacterium]